MVENVTFLIFVVVRMVDQIGRSAQTMHDRRITVGGRKIVAELDELARLC
jgi:hypothetical protein